MLSFAICVAATSFAIDAVVTLLFRFSRDAAFNIDRVFADNEALDYRLMLPCHYASRFDASML